VSCHVGGTVTNELLIKPVCLSCGQAGASRGIPAPGLQGHLEPHRTSGPPVVKRVSKGGYHGPPGHLGGLRLPIWQVAVHLPPPAAPRSLGQSLHPFRCPPIPHEGWADSRLALAHSCHHGFPFAMTTNEVSKEVRLAMQEVEWQRTVSAAVAAGATSVLECRWEFAADRLEWARRRLEDNLKEKVTRWRSEPSLRGCVCFEVVEHSCRSLRPGVRAWMESVKGPGTGTYTVAFRRS
jgi:hypothetical protein